LCSMKYWNDIVKKLEILTQFMPSKSSKEDENEVKEGEEKELSR
jgi:hypothetical protein